jgi:ketosteroid isomerase-like protein
VEAEVRAASHAFDRAYATNDMDTYFDFYTDDAVVFFYGSRQVVAEYEIEWKAFKAAGGGVEKNEPSVITVGAASCRESSANHRTKSRQDAAPTGDVGLQEWPGN